MKKYSITSGLFAGEVVLTFSEAGCLVDMDFADSRMSEQQQTWLLRNIPVSEESMKFVVNAAQSLRLQEIPDTVTFEAFWNAYDDKVCSNKRRCLAKWEKMTATEQVRAYRYIGTYFRNLPAGTRKKYAETYLNAELWNNRRK